MMADVKMDWENLRVWCGGSVSSALRQWFLVVPLRMGRVSTAQRTREGKGKGTGGGLQMHISIRPVTHGTEYCLRRSVGKEEVW